MACTGRKNIAFLVGVEFLLFCWMLLSPSVVHAHAVLLRSNPPIGAVLKSPPSTIQIWFNENMSPTFTTSSAIRLSNNTTQNENNEQVRVDLNNAHLNSNDTKELDLSLKPNLPPAVYLVFYRTQSATDGHILSDSFLFTVAEPNGTVPTYNGSLPPPPLSDEIPESTEQLTQSMFFNGLMITLVELGVVFWVGAQLWMTFVFELTVVNDADIRSLDREATLRFNHRFSIPILLLILLANIGILIGQALAITGGQWFPALNPSLLISLVRNTSFGVYWIMREVVIILALFFASGPLLFKQGLRSLTSLFSWVNLVLGLALLLSVTFSGHAAAVDNTFVVSSVLIDWIHLLAASLWVGGIFYLAIIYLPVLWHKPLKIRTAVLLNTLSRYSPLAIAGVVLMAVSGPSNATAHIPAWEQLFTTTYGRTLIIKMLLIATMLLTSALHVFRLRPRLKKTYQQYIDALDTRQQEPGILSSQFTAQTVKALEKQVQQQTSRLTKTLIWEALPGVAILLCTGLLNIFAGTLQPVALSQPPGASVPQLHGPTKTLVKTVKTTDNLFTITLIVSPNHQGPNVFTVQLPEKQKASKTITSISIAITLPGMDMGTTTINLQPDGKGNFSGNGNFSMSGKWRFYVEIHTQDKSTHSVRIEDAPT